MNVERIEISEEEAENVKSELLGCIEIRTHTYQNQISIQGIRN